MRNFLGHSGMENQHEWDNTLALIFAAEESLNNNKVHMHCSVTTTLYFLQHLSSYMATLMERTMNQHLHK